LTGLIAGQKMSYSADAQKRIEKICEALNGTWKVPKTPVKKGRVTPEAMKIYFK